MRSRPLSVLLLTLALIAGAASTAGAAQSDNVQRIAQLPEMATAISINFIGDAMFVSTVTGVYAYDVANPAAPKLLSALPMYIWENEDVDVDPVRKRLFVSRDPRGFTSPVTPGSVFPFGAVQIIDVSNPRAIHQIGAFLVAAGHTTTCINDCDVIWTAGPVASLTTQSAQWGGRPIFATDVRDPLNPVACPHPIDTSRDDGKTTYVHDVQVDAAGVAWVSGEGGVRGYWTRGWHRNPFDGHVELATGCDPIPYGGSGTPETATPSRFMHNAWRDYRAPAATARAAKAKKPPAKKRRKRKPRPTAPTPAPIPRNDVLLGTEEEVVSDCKTAGRFVAYDLRGTYDGEGFKDTARTHHRMKVLDTWTPEGQPGSSGCASSHYFTSRGDGLTANAFYDEGVRFLDTSDPADIRQVGYYRQDDSNTWAAYWHGDAVFVADFQRGVEVLRFSGAPGRARTVRVPATAHAAATGSRVLRFSASVFGGLCPLRGV